MDKAQKLSLLSSDMDLEPAEDVGCPKLSEKHKESPPISHAVLPGGKQIALLKTLLTSACERNCFYCPFRAGRDFRRETLKPDEMAGSFMALHQAGMVQGMFLSSGIAGGGVRSQDKLIDTAEILRHKYGYQGYLHLKVMPGAEKEQIEQAMRLADRVSVNLEAPNLNRLELLAPRKEFAEELLKPLRWIEEIRRSRPAHMGWKGRWPSMTTQFVVGAVGESDLELLETTGYLYRQLRLSRAYFSAFRPIAGTPLEDLPAESPVRQNRLYQASFLLRDYGFDLENMPFDSAGRLPLDTDPKLAWAEANLVESPVDVNRARRQELLRIPGIGPRGADAILAQRRQGTIRELGDLGRMGINSRRAAPFILLGSGRPARQLALW